MKTPTICILYGVNEGPAIGRALEHTCIDQGFELVKNPAAADIIFAHSGGCLLVPPQNKAKLIVQVGIPYWPGRPWLFATSKKVWLEMNAYRQEHRLSDWFYKLSQHARYMWNLGPALRMLRNLSPAKPWNSVQPQVIVRNRDDVYCCSDIHTAIAYRGPRTFVSLPGQHDDCWEHPKRYVDLIQSLYE